ncbi:MAG: alpha/beta fold hydrolase [Candidatus Competibacteraceae bacterium]
MSEELELQTPYLRLAARAWGPLDGVPVLALHGWLDNAASFDALAPLLPNTRLVALDLTGHGRSEHRPAGVHYHFVDFIPDVVAAADALGWNRFALLGHSGRWYRQLRRSHSARTDRPGGDDRGPGTADQRPCRRSGQPAQDYSADGRPATQAPTGLRESGSRDSGALRG